MLHLTVISGKCLVKCISGKRFQPNLYVLKIIPGRQTLAYISKSPQRESCPIALCLTRLPELLKGVYSVNSFLTDDDTRSFCGQCRSRLDCTERAV